jgi:hypothetical protein
LCFLRKALVRPCVLSPRGSRAPLSLEAWRFAPDYSDGVCAFFLAGVVYVMLGCLMCLTPRYARPPIHSLSPFLGGRAFLRVLTHTLYQRSSLRGTGLPSIHTLALCNCLPASRLHASRSEQLLPRCPCGTFHTVSSNPLRDLPKPSPAFSV